jgi:hypothetical protein
MGDGRRSLRRSRLAMMMVMMATGVLVEPMGFEPTTSTVQTSRSPN